MSIQERQFNSNQKEKTSKYIISMSDPSTTITDDLLQEKTYLIIHFCLMIVI